MIYTVTTDIDELKNFMKCAMRSKTELFIEQKGYKFNFPKGYFDDISDIKIIGKNSIFMGIGAKDLNNNNIILENIIIAE